MGVSQNDLPVLLVDTREQRPLQFSHLPAESATLYTGDYSVRGLEEVFAVEHSLRAIQSRYGVHVERVYTEEQAARLVETWAFCAWREAMKPAGVSLPFPDWAVGVLCPRYLRPVPVGKVVSDMEKGLV